MAILFVCHLTSGCYAAGQVPKSGLAYACQKSIRGARRDKTRIIHIIIDDDSQRSIVLPDCQPIGAEAVFRCSYETIKSLPVLADMTRRDEELVCYLIGLVCSDALRELFAYTDRYGAKLVIIPEAVRVVDAVAI